MCRLDRFSQARSHIYLFIITLDTFISDDDIDYDKPTQPGEYTIEIASYKLYVITLYVILLHGLVDCDLYLNIL